MRKILFLCIGFALLTSCSNKTNEEKARDLIESFLENSIYRQYCNLEDYKFAKLKLDSCYSDDESLNPKKMKFALELAKLFNEYKDYIYEAQRAEASKPKDELSGLWCAQDEVISIANEKASGVKKEIIELFRKNKDLFDDSQFSKHEFIGWVGVYGKTDIYTGNFSKHSSFIFFMDKDFKKVNENFSGKDIELLESVDIKRLRNEFGVDLGEVFSE